MILDAVKPHSHKEILTRELNAIGIRLNRKPPQIYLRRKKTGGVGFNSTVPLTHMDEKMVGRIMQEYKVHNADILFKEDATVDDFIDVLEVRRQSCAGVGVQEVLLVSMLASIRASSLITLCSSYFETYMNHPLSCGMWLQFSCPSKHC
jgi:ribosome-interacting GTPase 1